MPVWLRTGSQMVEHKVESYFASAKKVKLVKTTATQYYGKGYQDVQNRVPRIADTMKDLGWKPRVEMREALRLIFDAYRTHVQEAARLVE